MFKNVDGDGKEKWYGFSIDLLERMAEQIGFDYELIGLLYLHSHPIIFKWVAGVVEILRQDSYKVIYRIVYVKHSKEYFDYGSLMIGPNGTKKWSGLVGAVESGDADFAVSAMTVTPQR